MEKSKKKHKAWVVTVDMGYGHQRATYPLHEIAYQNVLSANTYRGIPKADKSIWENSRHFYEFISRFTQVPIIGQKIFDLYDKFQGIPDFYPKRDLSRPSFQLKEIMQLIEHRDWGKHLIDKMNKNPQPLITSFFAVAFMAEYFGYKGEIYCVICDADIARVWADMKTANSRINYFAPCYRVVERLKLYGVKPERIFLTGFPLPKENLGGTGLQVLRHDLSHRLYNLDHLGRYLRRYGATAQKQLNIKRMPIKQSHPLTLTFAVGGAGAQREIGVEMVNSLRHDLRNKRIHINLVAGVHNNVEEYFTESLKDIGLRREIGKTIRILHAETKADYFKQFNHCLRTTDILWTKPSELSFYPALGIPIIMAPPIGSQEEFNKLWLKTVGAGISQNDPRYANEWIFEWVDSGWLAQAAMRGFLEIPRFGTYNIEKIIAQKPEEILEVRSVLQY